MPSVSDAETNTIQSHICIFVLVFCELQYFFGDLMITRRPYYFQQALLYIYQNFLTNQIGSKIHGFAAIYTFFKWQVLHIIFNLEDCMVMADKSWQIKWYTTTTKRIGTNKKKQVLSNRKNNNWFDVISLNLGCLESTVNVEYFAVWKFSHILRKMTPA